MNQGEVKFLLFFDNNCDPSNSSLHYSSVFIWAFSLVYRRKNPHCFLNSEGFNNLFESILVCR